MTRTEKAIRDARREPQDRWYVPIKSINNAIDTIHEAYTQELSFSRFKTISLCLMCLSIGLIVGLIINA